MRANWKALCKKQKKVIDMQAEWINDLNANVEKWAAAYFRECARNSRVARCQFDPLWESQRSTSYAAEPKTIKWVHEGLEVDNSHCVAKMEEQI